MIIPNEVKAERILLTFREFIAILNVDLYGTAVLLEEVGKVIEPGGVGVTISSQSGFRMKQLTPKEDEQLACTPTEELLNLDL